MTDGAPSPKDAPSPAPRIALCVFLIIATGLFTALGVWQIERRIWKLDLIHQVDTRIHAAAAPAPQRDQWHALTPRDAYRHVTVRGTFLNDRETPIHATTVDGVGYWIVTPLRTSDGSIILVNRGFVPSEKRGADTRKNGQVEGETEVSGLLRLTEPHGHFLQANAPDQDRWYSRDVAAIAVRRNLADVAPYFIDADAAQTASDSPIGGLTVVSFPNNHLVYAITWFGLALMSFSFAVVALRKT